MKLTDATTEFIKEHVTDDPSKLAFQAKKYPDVDMPFVITQIVGRRIAMDKIPSWGNTDGLIYPRHLSLEQCSSEATARYKSALIKGNTLVDMTGGMGIDCAFLSANFQRAVYVERQQELCEIASLNFPLLGLEHIDVVNGDGVEYLSQVEKVDWLFLDPARRNEQGGKVVAIADCEPNVAEISELLVSKAGQVLIKLSPMLDLSLALHDLPFAREVYVVSVANECKELLVILRKESVDNKILIHCVNILKNGEIQTYSFDKEQEQQGCEYTQTVGRFLYEPNASILKAGAYKSMANSYKLKKLHSNSHLYTSDQLIADFPGRKFECEAVFSLNKKELKVNLEAIKQANITVRNFPSSVAELRKRLKLSDGGDTYLFATTLMDEQKVLVKCHKS
ncbi:SAM-dependent methyltransferase [uncultured Bacteroides sp.]|uniref:THUMP-like domain-containing protein n=1 Tax=uncultured Bacteroides sp. TaxID=162156 RepID=UPI002AABB952|nr:SAM-dependent methyltransferase [uncultured Bacteroides sp.]